MHTSILSNNAILTGVLVVLLLLLGTSAHAQLENIQYPIAELGNCANQDACKTYCDDPDNIQACIDFGERNKLITQEEAERSRTFEETISQKGGPGGCDNPIACERFCNDVRNLKVCIEFADDQEVLGLEVEESKKLLRHIESGKELPGGCTNEATCRSYCDDFRNIRECAVFIQEVGFETDDGEGAPLTIEEAALIENLLEKGDTPGGCKSWEACDQYCQREQNARECYTFGVEVGFINPDEEPLGGPGGCIGEQECSKFCEENPDVCEQFAKDHGLEIETEEIAPIDHLDFILETIPSDVQACARREIDQKPRDITHDQIDAIVLKCFDTLHPVPTEDELKEFPVDEFNGFEFKEDEFKDEFRDDFKPDEDFKTFEEDKDVFKPEPKFEDEFKTEPDLFKEEDKPTTSQIQIDQLLGNITDTIQGILNN